MSLNQQPLRLLSFDGGGVRGLSSLLILQRIMHALNHRRREKGERSLEPCECFDMIAGTSTGGLIAIMLGTLRMSVDDCITSYLQLTPRIFPEEGFISRTKVTKFVKAVRGNPRFDATVLEEEIKKLVRRKGLDEDVIFDRVEGSAEMTCLV